MLLEGGVSEAQWNCLSEVELVFLPQMVLDNRVYDGLEGPWRDLFQRLKWDIVKSVLKSMTGLQGRKVKVRTVAPFRFVCVLPDE